MQGKTPQLFILRYFTSENTLENKEWMDLGPESSGWAGFVVGSFPLLVLVGDFQSIQNERFFSIKAKLTIPQTPNKIQTEPQRKKKKKKCSCLRHSLRFTEP